MYNKTIKLNLTFFSSKFFELRRQFKELYLIFDALKYMSNPMNLINLSNLHLICNILMLIRFVVKN